MPRTETETGPRRVGLADTDTDIATAAAAVAGEIKEKLYAYLFMNLFSVSKINIDNNNAKSKQ